MRVAIDVTTALTQRAGVGRYTRDLVRALAHLPDGPDLRPFYVAPDALYELGAGLPVAALPRPIRWWRLAMLLQHATRRTVQGPWSGADVYHAPDVVFPSVGTLPVVSTVHDLSYVVYPQYHTRLNGGYLRLLTPLMARRARLVIAVSRGHQARSGGAARRAGAQDPRRLFRRLRGLHAPPHRRGYRRGAAPLRAGRRLYPLGRHAGAAQEPRRHARGLPAVARAAG